MSSSRPTATRLAPVFPTTLALRAIDRWLESAVLPHLARSADAAGRRATPRPRSPGRPEPGDVPESQDETRILGHALRIAEALAGVDGPAVRQHRGLFAELAIGLSLRLEDDLAERPGLTDPASDSFAVDGHPIGGDSMVSVPGGTALDMSGQLEPNGGPAPGDYGVTLPARGELFRGGPGPGRSSMSRSATILSPRR